MVAAVRNLFLCNIFLTVVFRMLHEKLLPTFIHLFNGNVRKRNTSLSKNCYHSSDRIIGLRFLQLHLSASK